MAIRFLWITFNKWKRMTVPTDQFDWPSVQSRLKNELGDTAFQNWLTPVYPHSLENGQLALAVPNRMVRNWVKTHYGDRLTALIKEVDQSIKAIDYIISEEENSPSGQPLTASSLLRARTAKPTASAHAPEEGEANIFAKSDGSNLDARFTFDNFVVGKPNELAFAAARRVTESEGVSFNPLFLYGGVGLGKTHLMHAIAWAIREKQPHRNVVYMSAEKFMYQFIRALRFKDTMAFKEQFRAVDVLMIDDVQFIAGKESTQEEFFHTFNALVDQNRQIILSADKSPSEMDGIEERLKSRLSWGLVADIHPTTYELRLGILESKRDKVSVDVPQKVLEFLAHKITSNVRELEGSLNRIIAHAELMGRPITLEGTQDVLGDLLRSYDRRVTMDDIQKKVCEHYAIRLSDMHSTRRARAVARPRQVAMYLCKTLTPRSLPDIGRGFGGRDHTTIMHGVKKVEELMASDQQIADDVEMLTRALKNG